MREVRACESPVSFGVLRRTINVHKMHCYVVRDPFSNLYLQCVYEFRISSASLPIESNLCFSRQLFVDSACLHSSTDNHGDSFRSVIILNRRTCLHWSTEYKLESEWAASSSFCQFFVSPVSLCLLSTQKPVWNVKQINWKHKPDRRFCLHLVLVQISSRADHFDCFPRLAVYLTFRVLFAICFVFKRLCVMNQNANISVSICCHIQYSKWYSVLAQNMSISLYMREALVCII